MHISALIAAGGSGKRMNSSISKQFLNLKGHPILYYTLKTFTLMKCFSEIALVTGKQDIDYTRENIIKPYGFYN